MKIIITEGSRERIALKWLNKEFGDLTPVVKGDRAYKGIRTYYVDKNRQPLFYYYYDDRKNDTVYINYPRIWIFFTSIFNLEYKQTQAIIKVWLDETYDISGLIPVGSELPRWILDNTIN